MFYVCQMEHHTIQLRLLETYNTYTNKQRIRYPSVANVILS